MREKYLAVSLFLILLLTVYAFVFPKSTTSDILKHYNGLSSLVLVVLTFAYVVTTSRQLNTMQTQLKVMDESVNLQVQPLPIPRIDRVYLEKVNAYRSPDDDFSNIHIIYRFHCKISFDNVGSGAALNLSAYPVLNLKKEIKYIANVKQVHCVTDKSSNQNKLSFMILDKNNDILNNLLKGLVEFELELFYKNVFGAGFNVNAKYLIRINKDCKDLANQWNEFFTKGIKKYEVDLKRFHALVYSVEDDAKEIFNRIRNEVNQHFTEDLILDHWIKPESFELKLVEFNQSLEDAQIRHKQNLQNDPLMGPLLSIWKVVAKRKKLVKRLEQSPRYL